MTREEVAKLIYVVKATYPRVFARYTDAETRNMIIAWHMVLEHYNYAEASQGLKVCLTNDTSGFPPSPGQVIDGIQKAKKPAESDMTELEAWALVRKAIGRAGYYSEEEFDKLPPLVRKTVGAPGNLREWAMMDADTVESVGQSHFIRNFRTVAARVREEAKLPENLRLYTQAIAESLSGDASRAIETTNEPEGELATVEQITEHMRTFRKLHSGIAEA